jgi:putative oxidoreductase
MRIVAGGLFAMHGAQKIFGVFGGKAVPIASMYGAGGIIEIVCGVMIMIGFLAGIAAFIASGEMAVAYFMSHAPAGPVPLQNGGEVAALYAFVFLFIASRGSGRLSVG